MLEGGRVPTYFLVGILGAAVIECSVSELKAKLSGYIEKVEQGETVVVKRHGRPVANLVAPGANERSLVGILKGEVWASEDAFEPDPELEALVYESKLFPDEQA